MRSVPLPAVHPEFMLEPIIDAGSGRDAIGLGQARQPGLDVRHGTVLTLEDISVSFDGFKALNALNLYIGVGELRCIIGPNGAGKTTLLRMLATLSRPTEGTVTLAGIDVKEEPERVRETIGLISHNPMLYPDLTAEENLLLYAKLYGVADPEHRVIELLDAVGLKHRRLDRVRTFSRGMTQRVSIARALVNDPSVVLLDEPYSGLDPHAMHIFDELIASVREGRTFVMVSHDLDKGLALASHVLVLARGRVVHFGEKDQMSPDEFADLYRTTVGMGVS